MCINHPHPGVVYLPLAEVTTVCITGSVETVITTPRCQEEEEDRICFLIITIISSIIVVNHIPMPRQILELGVRKDTDNDK